MKTKEKKLVRYSLDGLVASRIAKHMTAQKKNRLRDSMKERH